MGHGIRGTLVTAVALALIASAPTAVARAQSGGVNTGLPGSTCEPVVLQSTGAAPPVGFVADPLGPDAPAAVEGDVLSGHARGIALLLHGGGWSKGGPGALETTRPASTFWRNLGWRVVNATYRGCSQSDDDVLWAVDRIHALRPELPICIHGASAGGHLGLLAASLRPGVVDCVVGEGAPADGAAALTQPLPDPGPPQATASWLHHLMVAAFGDGLDEATPDPARITARVLMGIAENDNIVPFVQATDLRDAMLAHNPAADVTAVRLAAGTQRWAHGRVSAAAVQDWVGRMTALVQATAGPAPVPPGPPPTTPTPTPTPTPAPVSPRPSSSPAPAPAPSPTAQPGAEPPGATSPDDAPQPDAAAGNAPQVASSAGLPVRISRARGRLVVRVRAARSGRVRVVVRSGRRTLARAARGVRAARTATFTMRLRRPPRRVTVSVSGGGISVRRSVTTR